MEIIIAGYGFVGKAVGRAIEGNNITHIGRIGNKIQQKDKKNIDLVNKNLYNNTTWRII